MINPDRDSESQNAGSVAKGFFLGLVLTIVQGGLTILAANVSNNSLEGGGGTLIIGLGAFGLIQLVYMAPLYFSFRRRQKTATAKGLLIEACVVLLCNATCWGVAALKR
jgi:hypothetical protein